jgi:hypothetical protein
MAPFLPALFLLKASTLPTKLLSRPTLNLLLKLSPYYITKYTLYATMTNPNPVYRTLLRVNRSVTPDHKKDDVKAILRGAFNGFNVTASGLREIDVLAMEALLKAEGSDAPEHTYSDIELYLKLRGLDAKGFKQMKGETRCLHCAITFATNQDLVQHSIEHCFPGDHGEVLRRFPAGFNAIDTVSGDPVVILGEASNPKRRHSSVECRDRRGVVCDVAISRLALFE